MVEIVKFKQTRTICGRVYCVVLSQNVVTYISLQFPSRCVPLTKDLLPPWCQLSSYSTQISRRTIFASWKDLDILSYLVDQLLVPGFLLQLGDVGYDHRNDQVQLRKVLFAN